MFARYISPQSVTGLHIHLLNNSERRYTIVKLEQKKGIYNVVDKVAGLNSLKDVTKYIKSKELLILSFTGNILNKITDNTENALNIAIPGFKKDDYYVQRMSVDEKRILVALTRKHSVDDILKELDKMGYSVLYVLLGIIPSLNTAHLLEQDNETSEKHLLFSDIAINFKNEVLQQFYTANSNPDEIYQIKGERISVEYIPAYFSILNFLQDFVNKQSIQQPAWVIENLNKWKANRMLISSSYIILCLWFAVLSGSFLINNSLSDKNKILKDQYNNSYQYIAQLDTIERRIKELEFFVRNLGMDQPSRFAFYADCIAQTVPVSITLTNLQIEPVNSKSKGAEIEFIRNTIYISGTCNTSITLNSWINTMNKLDWVIDITLNNYSKLEGKNTGLFDLVITLK